LIIGFDAAAFQVYIAQHPEVVDPAPDKIREFLEQFVKNADLETVTLKNVYNEVEKKFGPVRRALLGRVKQITTESIQKRTAADEKAKSTVVKDKVTVGQPAPEPFKVNKGTGREEYKRARIECPEDVTWAAATLAPFGLSADTGEPLVRAPPSVALPIMCGLSEFENMECFREQLVKTQLGKVVNAFKASPAADVAKVARELVTNWRLACKKADAAARPAKRARVIQDTHASSAPAAAPPPTAAT